MEEFLIKRTSKKEWQTGKYIPLNAKRKSIYNETPAGDVDNINTIFTTALTFITGTTRVYFNGARQKLGLDYYESGNAAISFIVAPELLTETIIDYDYNI